MDPPSAAFLPLGSPLDVADQLSFLDVSLEDDSLLPLEELPNPGHGPHAPSGASRLLSSASCFSAFRRVNVVKRCSPPGVELFKAYAVIKLWRA
jgi:hypothetical protein